MFGKPYNNTRVHSMSASDPELRAAYAECRRMASRHYENFPTASYLVPRDKRDALAAVYAFARYADNVADEPGVENRLEEAGRLARQSRRLLRRENRSPGFPGARRQCGAIPPFSRKL